jgi:hypothetical protein
VLVAATLLAACGGDEPASRDVDAAAALTAIVEWQADDREPVLDDNGDALLPVIYVAAGDGGTIDVGVQATVAAAAIDVATVRFADDVADAFDTGIEGEPVIGDGVMLLIGAMPEPARTVVVPLQRFTDSTTAEALELEIRTDPRPTGIGPATVIAVTQP